MQGLRLRAQDFLAGAYTRSQVLGSRFLGQVRGTGFQSSRRQRGPQTETTAWPLSCQCQLRSKKFSYSLTEAQNETA